MRIEIYPSSVSAVRDNGNGQYPRPIEVLFFSCLHDAGIEQSALTDNLIEDICRCYSQATWLAQQVSIPALD